MPSLTNYSNEQLNGSTSTDVFYYGVNGFGITWTYFIVNIVLLIVAGIGIVLNGFALKIVSFKFPLGDVSNNLSLVMRKPDFCICENKDADQLRGDREADQRLCFRYMDSTIPLLFKSEISRF